MRINQTCARVPHGDLVELYVADGVSRSLSKCVDVLQHHHLERVVRRATLLQRPMASAASYQAREAASRVSGTQMYLDNVAEALRLLVEQLKVSLGFRHHLWRHMSYEPSNH